MNELKHFNEIYHKKYSSICEKVFVSFIVTQIFLKLIKFLIDAYTDVSHKYAHKTYSQI